MVLKYLFRSSAKVQVEEDVTADTERAQTRDANNDQANGTQESRLSESAILPSTSRAIQYQVTEEHANTEELSCDPIVIDGDDQVVPLVADDSEQQQQTGDTTLESSSPRTWNEWFAENGTTIAALCGTAASLLYAFQGSKTTRTRRVVNALLVNAPLLVGNDYGPLLIRLGAALTEVVINAGVVGEVMRQLNELALRDDRLRGFMASINGLIRFRRGVQVTPQ